MSYLIGCILALSSIQISLAFLDQNLLMYIDDVAFAMVVGGTLAVAIISAPWKEWRFFFSSSKKLVMGTGIPQRKQVIDGLEYVRNMEAFPLNNTADIAQEIYTDGKELIQLNFSPEDIQTILSERLEQLVANRYSYVNFLHSLSKYPPAFGLVGTVLGLVNLMRAISEGIDPSQTGAKMALALVATLYGLVLANFIISPFSEGVEKIVKDQQRAGEIALQAVLLRAEEVNLLKSQEMLNSFLPRSERVNIINEIVSKGLSA